ncbi:MAG: ATP-dependent RecD-like DNA helicase [Hungatella sp.]|uniref:SF1B family DNA helicase RecD2 n=1 Tax=Hungatella sp. TaxID=2613924 RepID=UPI00399A25EC
MICKFEHRQYVNPSNGYTVATYRSGELSQVPEAGIKMDYGTEVVFTAVGTELPCLEDAEIQLDGRWEISARYGMQLQVEQFQVILPKSKEGIIGYLSSGLVKGIGLVTARARWRSLEKIFHVLETEPDRLLSIKGITQQKLETILESYRNSEEIRQLMVVLAPFKVTPKKAEKIWQYFGYEAVEIVKESPYRLCEISGFGFLTVDPVARASQGFLPDDPMRIKAAIQYVLKEAEGDGHLYLESRQIIDKAHLLLTKGFQPEAVSRNDIIRAGNELVLKDKILEADGTSVFLKMNREAEKTAAYHIVRLLKTQGTCLDIEKELEEAQAESGIILAQKQKDAARMVFQSPVSIITGGPGKGKTTVLKVILNIYERLRQQDSVLLCAPTGRARKNLSDSTGAPAMTIHKALYLTVDSEDDLYEDELLEEDLIIVDECTMMDMWLASILFSRVKSGARLVLVGDVDQLPSVGPGNVFKELIDSGIIPVTVLDVFFRQAKESRIILNAERINKNQKKLLYGDDFQFHMVGSDEEAAKRIGEICQEELKLHEDNPDMVQVLTPLRVNTEAGVIALNRRLQEIINPPALDKEEWKAVGAVFRVGDKVMQTKNVDDISNGDIGRVTKIMRNRNGSRTMTVDFGEISKEYEEEELSILEHAYAISIHKSQGGEYPVVILPVLRCFYPMLKRNVYYTGITRAKAKVYLVGSKADLAIVIGNNDIGKRNTMLAARLRSEAQLRGYEPGKLAA